jgi:hypothetical protein
VPDGAGVCRDDSGLADGGRGRDGHFRYSLAVE